MSRFIRVGAIVVGILVGVMLVLPFFVDVNAFRPKLESELSTALERQVKVGNLSLSIFSGSVKADNISIADDPAFSQVGGVGRAHVFTQPLDLAASPKSLRLSLTWSMSSRS